jgi:hypothetical protein
MRGIVDNASGSRTDDRGFESRQGSRFKVFSYIFATLYASFKSFSFVN